MSDEFVVASSRQYYVVACEYKVPRYVPGYPVFMYAVNARCFCLCSHWCAKHTRLSLPGKERFTLFIYVGTR